MRDRSGAEGASALSEDTLSVELRAGRPAKLAVEGLATLEYGTKAAIPQLRVRVCDAGGNPVTTSETFEVRWRQRGQACRQRGGIVMMRCSGLVVSPACVCITHVLLCPPPPHSPPLGRRRCRSP